jgi:hypothetical protein
MTATQRQTIVVRRNLNERIFGTVGGTPRLHLRKKQSVGGSP